MDATVVASEASSPMTWKQLLSTKCTRELLGGRARTSKIPSDTRTEFERDFDRAQFSTSFRRLQDKAQVFPLEPNDYVRTRLTHSIEVSTVAQSIARDVSARLRKAKRIAHEEGSAIRVIAATCGLVHDLGNPPFGHAGEDAMKEWFQARLDELGSEELMGPLPDGRKDFGKDFERFDGNPQTLRLLTHLQAVSDTYGLNLTAGTLSAAMKYTADCWDPNPNNWHERAKLGYFQSERELVQMVGEATGTHGRRNPLAIIVEAADDITYSTVDLEDGIRKKTLTWQEMVDGLREHGAKEYDEFELLIDEVQRYVNGGGLELRGSARDEAYVQMFRAFAIGRHVAAAVEAFIDNYDDIMLGDFHGELVKAAGTSPLLRAAKRVGAEYVYRADNTLKLEVRGRRILHDLMNVFWGAVRHAPSTDQTFSRTFDGKVYSLLSPNYRDLFQRAVKSEVEFPKHYLRLQLVADYVAGMTDTFALTLHHELCGG